MAPIFLPGCKLLTRLQGGDLAAARFIGVPVAALSAGQMTPALQDQLAPLLEKAALTAAINDAWAMIALLTAAALLCIPVVRRTT